MLSVPKHEDLIYDVGMHQGRMTHLYLKKGFRVVAFEALPEVIEANKKKFAKEIAEGRLTFVEGAITDQTDEKEITFYVNSVDPRSTALAWLTDIHNNTFGTSSTPIRVPAIDFAAAIQQYGMPYFMKIDIEGSDFLCVEALKKFEQQPTYLSIEAPTHSEISCQWVDDLAALGFSGFQVVMQNRLSHIHPSRHKKAKLYRDEPNPSREKNYAGYTNQEWSCLFGKDLPHKWKSVKKINYDLSIIRQQYNIFFEGEMKIKKFLFRLGKGGEFLFLKMKARYMGKARPWHDIHAKHKDAHKDADG